MANLQKAKFRVLKQTGSEDIVVQYNPNSLTFDKKPKIAPINIPGIDSPLQQFVRGEGETLSVELFFDSTEQGTGANATSVTVQTDKFYGLVKIDPQTHAIPICVFVWGQKFPGDSLPEMYQNQRRTEFKGLVTDVKQEFKLFSPEGTPQRAVLTISMTEYKPLHEQLQQLNLQSPDHTRSYVVQKGDTLSSIAYDFYLNPADWRLIANGNDIEDPRRLDPARTLLLPPVP
jgi:hypothetical protein